MTATPYWLRPYYALRPPPQDSLAFGLAYALLAFGAAMSASVHDPEHVETVLAVAAASFAAAGGVTGTFSQFRGLWNFERGAIWMIWGGLLTRSVVIVMLADTTFGEVAIRAGSLLAICLLLIPRYRMIVGADRDPHK